MTPDFILSALVTLVVTIDPIGLTPVFLSLGQGMTPAQRRGLATRGVFIALCVLIFFLLAGRPLLGWLGIELAAFRIAGGLLLFVIAFEMVFDRRSARKEKAAATAVTRDHIRDLAVFPLAIPLLAGPGAIAAIILLSTEADGSPLAFAALLGLLLAVMGAALMAFLSAERLSHLLGNTGHVVLTRLLGVILTALAVQFVVDGARELGVF